MTRNARYVQVEIRGVVAEIRLSRPQARNAVDLALAHELDDTLTDIEGLEDVRVMMLTAQGPAFCAGQDLKALAAGEPEAFIEGSGWAGITHRNRTKPLIAVVQGPALAGGFEIVLASDLVVASTDASFGLPEIHHGLIAAAGGAARLPNRIPLAIAKEMLLTGDPIDAARAASLGLVNLVVNPDELARRSEQLATRLATHSPDALRATIEVVNCSRDHGERAADLAAEQLLAELHDSAARSLQERLIRSPGHTPIDPASESPRGDA